MSDTGNNRHSQIGLPVLLCGIVCLMLSCQSLPERADHEESYLAILVERGSSPNSVAYKDALPMIVTSSVGGRQRLVVGMNYLRFPANEAFLEIREIAVASPKHDMQTAYALQKVGLVIGKPRAGSIVLLPVKFTYTVSADNNRYSMQISTSEFSGSESKKLVETWRSQQENRKTRLKWENIEVWDRGPAFKFEPIADKK